MINGNVLYASKIGKICVGISNDDESNSIWRNNVYYVEGSTQNLLSVSKMTRNYSI